MIHVRRMWRLIWPGWLCVIFLACRDEGPKDALTLAAVNGLWLMPFTKAANCSTIVSGGEIWVQIAVTQSDRYTSDIKFGFAINAITHSAVGRVSLGSGALDMILHTTRQDSD